MSITINVIAGDNIINASEAGSAISGTNTTGATVNLTIGGINRAAIVTGTTWSYTLIGADITNMGQGSQTLTAIATVAGAGSIQREFTVDTVAPTATAAITAVTDDFGISKGNLLNPGTMSLPQLNNLSTDDTSLVLSGTITGSFNAANGDVVMVYDNATPLGAATVSGATWTFAAPVLGIPQTVNYRVRVEDLAGNTPTAYSTTFTTTTDNNPPTSLAQISDITDNQLPIGTVAVPVVILKGKATNDTTPTIRGTTSAAVGEIIHVYRTDVGGVANTFVEIGQVTVSGSTWSFTDTFGGLASGLSYRYQARVGDVAGNIGITDFGYNVQLKLFAAPPMVAGVRDDFGISSTDGTTSDTTVTIFGYSSPDATVTLYRLLGVTKTTVSTTIVADSVGYWEYVHATLAQNTYFFSAGQTDNAGNVSLEGSQFRVTIDTSAPTTTTNISGLFDDVGSIQGLILNGGVTNDLNPELRGSIGAPLGSDASGNYVVGVYSSFWDTSLAIPAWVYTRLGTATMNTATTWSFWDTREHLDTIIYVAKVEDVAGNGVYSASYTVTFDSQAPDATPGFVLTDDVGSIQGDLVVLAATASDDTNLGLSGMIDDLLAPGEVVNVYIRINGGAPTLLGLATLDTSNQTQTFWTYTDVARTHGTKVLYSALVEDAVGNQGLASFGSAALATIGSMTLGGNTITVVSAAGLAVGDFVEVEGAGVNDTTLEGHITGIAGNVITLDVVAATDTVNVNITVYHYITIDTVAPTQTAAVTRIDDDVPLVVGIIASGSASNDMTPLIGGTITGALAADEGVYVYRDGVNIGIATVTGGTWSFADTLPDQGSYSYNARTQDLAGNVTAFGSAYTITIDTELPTIATTARVVNTNISFGFSENLLTAPLPATSSFGLKLNGGASTNPTAVGISTNTLTLSTATIGLNDIMEVTYTPGANVLQDLAGNVAGPLHLVVGGDLNDVINTGNYTTAGVDYIWGGLGADTIDAGGGDDVIAYSSLGIFISGGNVIDSVTGGAGIDKVMISGAFTLATTDNLSRINTVEELVAAGSTANLAFNIAYNSSANLGSIRTFDLSANKGTTSSTGIINMTGVGSTTHMTLSGVRFGANTLTGGSGDDVITGGSGNDVITGGAGADTLNGGAGNDIFVYATSAEFISGGAVVDSIIGGIGSDRIQIGGAFVVASTDSLARVSGVGTLAAASSASALTLIVQITNDGDLGDFRTIDFTPNTGSGAGAVGVMNLAGVGADMMLRGLASGANSITGGGGADTIYGGNGNDTINGGNGDNFYFSYTGNDSILGGTGNDTFNFVAGTGLTSLDTVTGGFGYDTVVLTGGAAIAATNFNNVTLIEKITVVNTTNSISITTLEGLVGFGATLTLNASSLTSGTLTFNGAAELGTAGPPLDAVGRFSITGGAGNDSITGGSGNDTMRGGLGVDTLNGGLAGDDIFLYSSLAEFMSGTAVIDTINGGTGGRDVVEIAGNITFTTTSDFTRSNNVLVLAAEATSTNRTFSITINDSVRLNDFREFDLSANTGAGSTATFNFNGMNSARSILMKGVLNGTNSFTGGNGNDTMIGGNGNDTFTGNTGSNNSQGGGGNDIFNFTTSSINSADTIDGGTGLDSLFLTGSATLGSTALNNVYSMEYIFLYNTSSTVTITTQDALVDDGATLTIQHNAALTAVMNFNGSLETGGRFVLAGGTANDILVGGYQNDTITGANGNDTITGGFGADTINLFEATPASDVVVVNAGDSTLLGGVDQIQYFNAVVTAGQFDRLDLPSTTIGANGSVNGTDVGIIKSHNISNGMIRFDSVNQSFTTAIVVNNTNLADVNNYLAMNIASGTTVGFYVDANNNGNYTDFGDYLRIFQGGAVAAGTASTDDLFVDIFTTSGLGGVIAISTAAAANTVVIM